MGNITLERRQRILDENLSRALEIPLVSLNMWFEQIDLTKMKEFQENPIAPEDFSLVRYPIEHELVIVVKNVAENQVEQLMCTRAYLNADLQSDLHLRYMCRYVHTDSQDELQEQDGQTHILGIEDVKGQSRVFIVTPTRAAFLLKVTEHPNFAPPTLRSARQKS